MGIKKIPQHVRKTKTGFVSVRAYTATALMNLRDATQKHTGPQAREAMSQIQGEMNRRRKAGLNRARTIQATRMGRSY